MGTGTLFRHTVATLAYRAGKVLRDAPDTFGAFDPLNGGKTASQIVAHMGDLMDWATSIAAGAQGWKTGEPGTWGTDVQRFFDALGRLDRQVTERPLDEALAAKLFQGPIADALTHVGQLAMMRRLAGSPMKGENYFRADMVSGRVSLDQSAPRIEF